MRCQALIILTATLVQFGVANPIPEPELANGGGHSWYNWPTAVSAVQDGTGKDPEPTGGHSWYTGPSPVARDGAGEHPEPATGTEPDRHAWYNWLRAVPTAQDGTGKRSEPGSFPWYNAPTPDGNEQDPVPTDQSGPGHEQGGHSWYGWPVWPPKATATAAAEA